MKKTDDPVIFVAVSANMGELVIKPSPIKGEKPHMESKYQALLCAEAELLGRKHVYVAVDRALKEQHLMVVDTKGIIRVWTVGSGSQTDQWTVPKLKAKIEELFGGK